MLLVSGISFNSKPNQKSVSTTPNYLVKNHSQQMTDVVNFKSNSVTKLPEKLTTFLNKYPQVFNGLEFRADGHRFVSQVIDSDLASDIACQYAELKDGYLIKLFEQLPVNQEGVDTFLKGAFKHRVEFPFDLETPKAGTVFSPQPVKKIILLRKIPQGFLFGGAETDRTLGSMIDEWQPELAKHIRENGLGGKTFNFDGQDYDLKPLFIDTNKNANGYYLAGIKWAKSAGKS